MTNKEKSKIQKEIVDSLPLKPNGRLILAPRIGKSKIIIDIIKKNNPTSILWVTPSSKLAEEDIPQEFEIWKAKKFIGKLKTVTWASLNKIQGYYEMIILDEEQFGTSNNLSTLLNNSLVCDYMLAMTGTQTKHENKNELYKSLKLKILYKLSINNAVDIGILSNYSINVVKIKMSNEKNLKAGNKLRPFLTTEISNYNWLSTSINNEIIGSQEYMFKVLARMRAIHNSPSKLSVAKYLINSLKGRKLFFCANIKQAEEICPNVYHSKTTDKDVQKFINAEIDSIAMVNAGGIGWTYKAIDHLVIVQSDSDSNGNVTQKISRTLLEQKNYKATIWILCLMETKDEKWIESVLETFDKTKINYLDFNELKI